MNHSLFTRYANAIRTLEVNKLTPGSPLPADFLLAQDDRLASYYTPFDVVNQQAKVVLVGITPGFTQWRNAMAEAQAQLVRGASPEQALTAAKASGAFSGTMRPNLVALLDAIGLHQWLKVPSASALFDSHPHLLQSTSIVRHATFVGAENYNGTPDMTRTPLLQRMLLEHFAQEAAQLPQAVFIPLGPKVAKGLEWLAARGAIDPSRVLAGLPHPSGANAERVAYFLGRKAKAALSPKTNPETLDQARSTLTAQLARLR